MMNNIYFVIFFIVTIRCSMGSSDAATTPKPSQTPLEAVKQFNTSTVDKGLVNVTEAAPQNKSNAEKGTAERKLTEATILNNTKCEEVKKEVCKTLFQSWNPNTCKCEEEVNNQNVTVGSNQNSSAVLSSTSSPLATNTTATPKKSFWSRFGEISFRSPFLPRLG